MSLCLIEDVNNKLDFHTIKNKWFEKNNIEVMRYGLPVGDYILADDRVMEMLARKKMRGIQPHKMDFIGTYNIAIDSKRDIAEICGNVCGKSHDRFRDELLLAKNNGIKLIILVENKGGLIKGTRDIYNPTIRDLSELSQWKNPRLFIRRNGKQLYPSATRGVSLMKACYTLKARYECDFVFCTPEESGEMIIKLLKGEQP